MKKKPSALDKYCIFSFICLLIFTMMVSIFQFIHPDFVFSDTLITAFFGAFGGELFLCAMIKRLKLKRGDTDEVDS